MNKKINDYMKKLGRKGGLAKSLKKTLAARKNALLSAKVRKVRKDFDSGLGIDPLSDLNQPESIE